MSSGSLVCVVDDDEAVCESIANLVRSAGFQSETFASARQFLQRHDRVAPGCLILDVQMPGLSGLDLQQELARIDARIPIIFITGHGDIPTSVRAMKAGAVEFLTKPFRDEDLLEAVEQALARRRQLAPGAARFADIVGESPALRRVLDNVAAAAPTECTVLICGETGTGKELVARAVHAMSPRSSAAFVKLNCAAIPATLMESELFGHERGAFTGAVAQRIGRFELAQGGSVFLDEIGELPLELQPKLLRVLQEREFERLGGTRTLKTDARLVAATNVNLAERAAAGEFRPDLFYRLNVFPVFVPPLRARREDIPLLVRHFLEKHAERMRKRIDGVAPATMQALVEHSWPGNVRELEHFIERSVILSRGAELEPPLSELAGPSSGPAVVDASPVGAPLTRRDAEREHVLRTLEQTGWVIGGPTGAAARLGMKRTTLQSLVKRLGLERPVDRTMGQDSERLG
jgi:DNA-binding NtrC family response regulator